jgi:hypothetical protein
MTASEANPTQRGNQRSAEFDPKRTSQAQVMADSTENVLLARMDAESDVKNPRNVASAHRITRAKLVMAVCSIARTIALSGGLAAFAAA